MNRNHALETIRSVGVFGLCGTEGCACLNFAVHSVNVDVACRKSSGSRHPGGTTVYVYSHHADYDGEEAQPMLRAIGEEVARQMAEMMGHHPKEDFTIILSDPNNEFAQNPVREGE